MSARSDWERELWPADEPDPDWPEAGQPDEAHWPAESRVPPLKAGTTPARTATGPRVLALALVAIVGIGAGAGAVYLYRNAAAGSTPAAAASPSPNAGGVVTTVVVLGPVLKVGRDSLTVGGPGTAVSAAVTSATRFTGAARSLAQVRAGDVVSVQITESGGRARVDTLQDPARQP